MAKYRDNLPQLNNGIFLTDGGLETTLIFHNGLELPDFAAFGLLKSDEGRRHLYKYYSTYAAIARDKNAGFILESATWRASSDWGKKLGYSIEELADMNRRAIELLSDIRNKYETEKSRMVISGCMGPRGDGYNPADRMSEEEAELYHSPQIETFSETDADMVSAFTMTYVEEAIGLARAAKFEGMPVVISFTVETDGRLPSGRTLKDAVEAVDDATDNAPAYYMVNCAHPFHFVDALRDSGSWVWRISGIRANASTKSHAELDEAEELDDGNPAELGSQYRELTARHNHINVLGGCCGTDHRHVAEISRACASGL
jgi:S-methylmethionine-dependent homocysteine/selenocysteine methylase